MQLGVFCAFLVHQVVWFGLSRQVSTSQLQDYLHSITSLFTFGQNAPIADMGEAYTPRIPYEVSPPDEKFISEAAKLTGVALSELDSCQQRVVLRLQTDCNRMNDEQLAKMAVHLLNCQSYVEGRPLFPCSDDMSIKDCTTNMDSDTWTSYHLMSNRARAVCYSLRQMQFRGLAEHTVNKLMDAAQDQLRTLGKISESQDDLQDMAQNTLQSLSKGHDLLTKQQRDLQSAQFHGQLALEDNIRKLITEKELILQAHNQLVDMTTQIQKRLDDSNRQLQDQVGENRQNHEMLIDDLIAIQNKAHIIFQRIEDSSTLLLQQNDDFKLQYEETLRNLAEVNKTVHSLVSLVGGTRQALEERLSWLTAALGGTDLAVERLYLIIWHSAFMLVSMLTCAFLSARLSTRLAVATLPPLNLSLGLMKIENQLDPLGLGAVIIAFVVVQTALLSLLSLRKKVISGALTCTKKEEESPKPEPEYGWKYANPRIAELDEFNEEMGSPTPPLSRLGNYSVRSRSTTPNVLNGTYRGSCHAKTRVGTPCKLSSLPGREFCYRHQSGESVMSS